MSWRRTRLKYLAAVPIVNGVGEPAEFDDPAWPRYIRTTDIAGPRALRDDTFVSLPPETAALAPVERGDILMSAAGTVGRTYLHASDEPSCFAGYLVRFRPKQDVDPRFISYWTQATPFVDQVAVGAVRSTIDNFSAGKYQNLWIDMPDLEEQRAIADYLDAETARIDALLEAKRRQAKLLVDHRRAVIDGFTVPAALGGQADAETAWPIAKLKRAAAFFADGDWIESPFITTDGIRLIQTGNIGEGIYRDQGYRYISDETFKTLGCTEVLPGDILISRLAGTVGRACLAPDLGTRMVVSVDVVIMRPVPDLDPAFAVAYFSSSYHIALAELLARGTTMPRLSRSQVGELPIPVPPLAVQRRVVGEIERRLAGLSALQVALDLQVARLLERRQALITVAVTGQLDIPGVAA